MSRHSRESWDKVLTRKRRVGRLDTIRAEDLVWDIDDSRTARSFEYGGNVYDILVTNFVGSNYVEIEVEIRSGVDKSILIYQGLGVIPYSIFLGYNNLDFLTYLNHNVFSDFD